MNWQKIIKDLLEAGLTQKQVAEAVGCGQPHISDILRGRRPVRSLSWDIGQALIDLHRNKVLSGS